MFRMIVVLILAEQGVFLGGVQTPAGFVERTFRNDEAGVVQFEEFSREAATTPDARYAICLTRHGSGEWGEVGVSLVLSGVQPAVVSVADYADFVARTQADPMAIVTAARACAARYPALFVPP